MSFKERTNLGFTLVELLVVIAIMATLASVSAPIIVKQIAKSRATHAINNAHDIAIGLYEFHLKYDHFPDSVTAAQFDTGTASANDYLSQLHYTSISTAEKPFFVKTELYNIAPDEIKDGGRTLEQGENIWSYFLANNDTGIRVNNVDANTPLLATPLTVGGNDATIRAEVRSFGNQVVFLRADKSAEAIKLNPSTGELLNMNWGQDIADYKAVLHE